MFVSFRFWLGTFQWNITERLYNPNLRRFMLNGNFSFSIDFFFFKAWKIVERSWCNTRLTDKLKCLLKVLFDVLVRRVVGRYLFVSNARFVLGRRWLTGDVENTIGTDTRRIDGVATVAEQQVRKNGRCWMRFNIWKWIVQLIKILFLNSELHRPHHEATSVIGNWSASQWEIVKDIN